MQEIFINTSNLIVYNNSLMQIQLVGQEEFF